MTSKIIKRSTATSHEDSSFFQDIEERLLFARNLAEKAGTITRDYFRRDLEFTLKADNTPVARVDKVVEDFLFREIGIRFPYDRLLGEETGEHCEIGASTKEFRWIIDPIDGTSTFLKGIPFFSILIGIEYANEPVAGVMHFPALKETYFGAPGYGAFWDCPYQKMRSIKVSESMSLSSSTFVCSSIDYFRTIGRSKLFETISSASGSTLGIPDAYAFALVASGRADFIVEAELKVWDVAAVKPIIEAAGGIFTDFDGKKTIYSSTAVASNVMIHKSLLRLTQTGLNRCS